MYKHLVFACIFLILGACSEKSLPKPSGELRLEYPSAKYQKFTENCPYSFDYSQYATVTQAKKDCWFYIDYPKMKAKIFITYFPVQHDFDLHVKEAEKLVYEHTIKASSIETQSFSYPEKRVYGNFYELNGESASNIQFYVTDSTKHFLTANLYFNTRPKPDSLAPAIEYIKKDMRHMIDTFQWK